MFDSGKTGSIEKEKVRTILNTLGHRYDDAELSDMLDSEDVEGMLNNEYVDTILQREKFKRLAQMLGDCSILSF